MGVEKGIPGTYVDIEAHQAEIRRMGAPLLWTLAHAVRRPGISAIELQVAEDFFDRIADEVLWATTEIYPMTNGSYYRSGTSQYWSESVGWQHVRQARVR